MIERYAEVRAIPHGQNESRIMRLPIIYNPTTNTYEVEGMRTMRIITMHIHWPSKDQDLLECKKIELSKEKERTEHFRKEARKEWNLKRIKRR